MKRSWKSSGILTAAVLTAALSLLSGCQGAGHERTVTLPEASEENYQDLAQLQTCTWSSPIPVFSLGWSQENGKSYIYTLAESGGGLVVRKLDVQYGFYQDIYEVPTQNCYCVWIAPDGMSVVYLSDEDEGLCLEGYNSQTHTEEMIAPDLYSYAVNGIWAGDSSVFYSWISDSAPDDIVNNSWFYSPVSDSVSSLWDGSEDLTVPRLRAAVSWDGTKILSLFPSEEELSDESKSSDAEYTSRQYSDTYSHWMRLAYITYNHTQLDALNDIGDEQMEEDGISSFGGSKEMYLNACLWKGFLDSDIGLIAVNQEETMAAAAESSGSGYTVYCYRILEDGSLEDRQFLYRGQNVIRSLRFSPDGNSILITEDLNSNAMESMGYADGYQDSFLLGEVQTCKSVVLRLEGESS